jgi:hypothetical protein
MREPVPIEGIPPDAAATVRPISLRKVEANRENALKSTGPRTAAGKRRSSLNARKHAVFAKQLIIATGPAAEKLEHYEQLRRDLWRAYRPVSPAQEQIVNNLVVIAWRRRRLARSETKQFEPLSGAAVVLSMTDPSFELPKRLDLLIRYDIGLHRQELALQHSLERLQRREAGEEVKPPSARV